MILLSSGPQENGAKGRFICEYLGRAMMVCGMSNLCTTSLPFTLGSASMCAGHPGLIAVSAPLVCPVGFVPQPFTAIAFAGATGEHHFASAAFVPILIPSLLTWWPWFPTFRYLNVRNFQVYLCIKQGMLYWIIAVQLVTSKEETWRSSPIAALLMSLLTLFLIY